MQFQKTTEYAIRVMVYLAKNRHKRLSAFRLHKDLNIPYKYLSRLMSKLAAGGLLDVLPGKTGGYKITKDLNSIYLYQIAELVEGLEYLDQCVLGFSECSDENPCILHNQWSKLRAEIKNMLYKTSLADFDYNKTDKY